MTEQSTPVSAEAVIPRKRGFRKWIAWTLLGAVAVLGAWVALNWYYMRAKDELRRLHTRRSALELQLALLNYSAVYQRLPHPVVRATAKETLRKGEQDPSAPELFSWRFELAPFLGNPAREWDSTDAWDAPSNAEWRAAPTQFAYEPSDLRHPIPNEASTMTRFLAITGPGAAFGDGKTEWPKDPQNLPGDLILVVEVRNSGLHWMQPGDLDIRTMPRTINAPGGKGISSVCRNGFHVLFANGSVWFLKHDTPFETLEKFFTIASAEKHDRKTLLKDYCLDRALDPEEDEELDGEMQAKNESTP